MKPCTAHPEGMLCDCTPCYFFIKPPPKEPRLFFDDKPLQDMVWAGFEPKTYTIFDQGEMGRWVLELDTELDLDGDTYTYGKVRELLSESLPRAKLTYTDFDQRWVWMLTDQTVPWVPHHLDQRTLRLGVWPD